MSNTMSKKIFATTSPCEGIMVVYYGDRRHGVSAIDLCIDRRAVFALDDRDSDEGYWHLCKLATVGDCSRVYALLADILGTSELKCVRNLAIGDDISVDSAPIYDFADCDLRA